MKEIKVKYDSEEITLTEGFISAVKNLLKEEILMMRKVPGNEPGCWTFGVCEITDLGNSNGITFSFCDDENKVWMKLEGQITIDVPLSTEVQGSITT